MGFLKIWQRQCSGKVRVDDLVPVLFGHGECGRALDFPGAVNQDVDFTEDWSYY